MDSFVKKESLILGEAGKKDTLFKLKNYIYLLLYV